MQLYIYCFVLISILPRLQYIYLTVEPWNLKPIQLDLNLQPKYVNIAQDMYKTLQSWIKMSVVESMKVFLKHRYSLIAKASLVKDSVI